MRKETMENFEKLGVFYLGREYELSEGRMKDSLLLYDSKDLTTHAVCVGMTGSGKTGLCIGLLEEAAIDAIPSIVVDPKGDLSNLMLTFPNLKPSDFQPWLNEEEAGRKNLSLSDFAENQSDLWRKGLAEWGQDSGRIQRLKEAADFAIYTPGSSAGLQVSILKSFEPPERSIVQDSDLLRERINTTVTSLLNLLDIEADPIQSREHILVSTILDISWKEGRDMGLAQLIHAIQSPPVTKIGVFDLDSFFPPNDRFAFAMKLNNLLAAPGFQAWLEGEPLDIDRLFYTLQGKPRVSIFSIAHLSDAERMFFVSLLLTQLLGWMRSQSGTSSLRALFYMDEIFGYFPPVAAPPSKAPLLTLLKQARAFGLGIVLATQNPVDLDYKGLSNTGTWFIGRLQTDRDKQRILDGLEGAEISARGRFNRAHMDQMISGLGNRIFLMNNVHEDEPVVFHTRWVLSYLRGPLTRNQIKQLMDPVRLSSSLPAETPEPTAQEKPMIIGSGALPSAAIKPILPPGISEYYAPARSTAPSGSRIFYQPVLIGMGKVYYAQARAGVTAEDAFAVATDFPAFAGGVRWDEGSEISITEDQLETFPLPDSSFGELPSQAAVKKNYAEWSRNLKDWIYRNKKLELLKSPSLSMVSQPGESERDFRVRLQLASREKRDMLIEGLRKKYAPKMEALEARISRAELAVEREKEQASQQKLKTAISLGATVFSALLGRKKVSQSSLGRAATTARSAGRIFKEGKDVERAEENVQELRNQLAEIQAALSEETERIRMSIDPLTENLETFVLNPKKSDILVSLVALAWIPHWQDEKGAFIAGAPFTTGQ